jgi:3-methyladenine DNA glycosylase AlkD
MLEVTRLLIHERGYRGMAYELLAAHVGAYASLTRESVEQLGAGIDSWSAVDSFARTLAGPAWRDGLLSDQCIEDWSASQDRWWRRAALVSTVALNMRSQGGQGDAPRTLRICRRLVDDHDDMVVKALSWALRALVPHDPRAVRAFLEQHEDSLAARVKREVRNKLRTGLKNPRRS